MEIAQAEDVAAVWAVAANGDNVGCNDSQDGVGAADAVVESDVDGVADSVAATTSGDFDLGYFTTSCRLSLWL